MPQLRDRVPEVDLAVGQLISLTGALLLLTQYPLIIDPDLQVALWWRLLSLVAPALIVVCAVSGRLLSYATLRALWTTIPSIGFTVMLLSFFAYTGSSPDTFLSWEWLLAGPYLSYFVLLMSNRWAITAGALTGFVPALSGLLRYGYIPAAATELLPIALANFAFAVLFIGIRSGLIRFHAARARASAAQAWSAQSAADARAQAEFSQLVHDSVLGTLSSAVRFSGSPPPELRRAAQSALDTIEANIEPSRNQQGDLSCAQLAEKLAEVAAGTQNINRVNLRTPDDMVPRSVAEAIVGATAEAVRNAAKHSRAAGIELSGEVSGTAMMVSIRDQGVGFDPTAVSTARLGIRGSILGRMGAVQGSAEISSKPGRGTEVRLLWEQ